MEREHFEKYIKDVTSHVRFRFDRREIAEELREHMEDLYEDLLAQGIEAEQAEELALEWMGDSEEVGKALDREHHPVLGWTWLILGVVCLAVVIKTVFGVIDLGKNIAEGYFGKIYPASAQPVVYTISPEIERQVYSYTLYIDKIVYYEDGMLEVDYATWRTPFSRDEYWSFEINVCPYVGDTPCYEGAGRYKDGRYYGKGQVKVRNVPQEADRLQVRANADLGNGWGEPIEISLTEGRVMAE